MTQTPSHGGDLGWLADRYPHAPRPILDLSTGVNPWPYAVSGIPAAAWTRLPQTGDVADARAAVAEALGVADPDAVVLVPGSEMAIRRLPELFPPGEAAVLRPTYATHADAWARAGHTVARFGAASLGDSDAPYRVVTNPNNPDGGVVDAPTLRAWARACLARGGRLVVDEAFADLQPDHSLAAEGPELGAVVLRSFGKTYGLPGLRAGAVVAPPELAGRLCAHLGAWPLSGPALAIMARAYRDPAWLAEMRGRCEAAAVALDRDLTAAGLHVLGGTALFRLAGAADAASLRETLARHGIAVRGFAEHPTWLRFGLPPDEAARARLQTALRAATGA